MDADHFNKLKRVLTPFKMEMVVTLASLRSLTLTAEYMGVSRPTVSLTVSRFEEICQFELFAIRGQTFELTEKGRFLVERFDDLLDIHSEIWKQVVEGEDDPGTVEVPKQETASPDCVADARPVAPTVSAWPFKDS